MRLGGGAPLAGGRAGGRAGARRAGLPQPTASTSCCSWAYVIVPRLMSRPTAGEGGGHGWSEWRLPLAGDGRGQGQKELPSDGGASHGDGPRQRDEPGIRVVLVVMEMLEP